MDPWDWGVDDVVQNICHSDGRLWADRPSARLPDFVALERKLREQDVDGPTLLRDVDLQVLNNDLGVQPLGQRSTLFSAITKLRQQSTRFTSQEAAASPIHPVG